MAKPARGGHDPDEWFTVKQVATMYVLSDSAVRRLITDSRQLRAMRVNTESRRPTYRIKGSWLNQYETRNEAD